MSAAYLRRLVVAAHDLSELDARIKSFLAQVDWSTCMRIEDDGEGRPLSCLQQDWESPSDVFADRPVCGACEENRGLLKRVKATRRERYLAMKRTIRMANHVTLMDAGS